MKAALLQMVSTTDVATNLDTAERLLAQAAQAGAELAVLPEYFCLLGQHDTDKLAIAEAYGDGPMQQRLAAMAQSYGVCLVAGTLPISVPGDSSHVSNTTLVYSAQGECVARYDKIHLFGFSRGTEAFDESRTIVAGDDVAVLQTSQLRVGLSICYDLRFPELYRAMGLCDLLVVPAAFTYTTGQAHWEILLRARAIENQCFVLAAAQGGKHVTGRRTWGHSMLVDPWGEILIQKPEGEGVVMGELDLAQLASVRASLPALQHRRL
jgi:nitrilase